MNLFRRLLIAIALFATTFAAFPAAEVVQASYFDIPLGAKPGDEVIGRIHLERNRLVHDVPVPAGYRFVIVEQPAEKLFKLSTVYDPSKRIMGVFTVDKGKNTGDTPPHV